MSLPMYTTLPDGRRMRRVVHIGDGVAVVRERGDDTPFCLKVSSLGHEALMLKRVQGHPNILKLVSSWKTHEDHFMLTELADKTLQRCVTEQRRLRTRFADRTVAHVVEDVANAICYLHSLGVIHRDVRPANIHLHPSSCFKLAGFELAVEAPSAHEDCGTEAFMAPEQKTGWYDRKVDVWALGRVAQLMMTFSLTKTPPDWYSDVLRDIVTDTLVEDSEDRIEAREVLRRLLPSRSTESDAVRFERLTLACLD